MIPERLSRRNLLRLGAYATEDRGHTSLHDSEISQSISRRDLLRQGAYAFGMMVLGGIFSGCQVGQYDIKISRKPEKNGMKMQEAKIKQMYIMTHRYAASPGQEPNYVSRNFSWFQDSLLEIDFSSIANDDIRKIVKTLETLTDFSFGPYEHIDKGNLGWFFVNRAIYHHNRIYPQMKFAELKRMDMTPVRQTGGSYEVCADGYCRHFATEGQAQAEFKRIQSEKWNRRMDAARDYKERGFEVERRRFGISPGQKVEGVREVKKGFEEFMGGLFKGKR